MKKSVYVLLSAALVASALAGCSSKPADNAGQADAGKQATEEKKEPMVLHWNWSGGEPPSADPGLGTDQVSFDLITANFEGLYRYDKDGETLVPGVAEKFEANADNTKFVVKVKKGLKWSNGDALTAHDFEFAWKRNLDPKNASEYAYQLYYLKGGEEFFTKKGKVEDVGVKATDDYTLEIQLKSPTPFFQQLLAFPTYFPLNKKAVETGPNWWMEPKTYIGNGPFKMESWKHKDSMVLVKNDNYWDKDNVKLDRIEFTEIEDDNTAQALFENGELDWSGYPAFGMPVDNVTKIKQEGKLGVKIEPGTNATVFNTQKAPFNNKHIRRAFALATERQTIADNVMQTGAPAAYGWVPPAMALNKDGFFKESVEEAKKELALGMKELNLTKFPEVTYKYNTGDLNKKFAEAQQAQWKKNLGIDVKLQNEEWKVFIKDRNTGNYDLARYAWSADFLDPINFLELWKEKGGNNDAQYDNPKYKEVLNKTYHETDLEKRKKLLLEAETILMDDMVISPLVYRGSAYQAPDYVKGFILNQIGGNDFKFVTVEKH